MEMLVSNKSIKRISRNRGI